MGADALGTQGARASVTMIFTMLLRINSVPHIKSWYKNFNKSEHFWKERRIAGRLYIF